MGALRYLGALRLMRMVPLVARLLERLRSYRWVPAYTMQRAVLGGIGRYFAQVFGKKGYFIFAGGEYQWNFYRGEAQQFVLRYRLTVEEYRHRIEIHFAIVVQVQHNGISIHFNQRAFYKSSLLQGRNGGRHLPLLAESCVGIFGGYYRNGGYSTRLCFFEAGRGLGLGFLQADIDNGAAIAVVFQRVELAVEYTVGPMGIQGEGAVHLAIGGIVVFGKKADELKGGELNGARFGPVHTANLGTVFVLAKKVIEGAGNVVAFFQQNEFAEVSVVGEAGFRFAAAIPAAGNDILCRSRLQQQAHHQGKEKITHHGVACTI